MRRSIGLGTVFPSCLCCLVPTRIGGMKNDPRNYFGKEVVVSGTVRQTFSLFVVKYFTLRDDTGEITIVTERPLPRQGQHLKFEVLSGKSLPWQ